MPLGSGDSWDETNPQQSTLANTLDSYDRDVRIGVRGRMANEHEWPSSQSVTSAAGQHKFITLQNQASKPTISGTQLAALYTKTVGAGLQELFWENELGTEVQIVSRTAVGQVPVFTKSFISATQTITNAGSLVLTHALGTMPSLIQCRLVNAISELGYVIADEVIAPMNPEGDAAIDTGMAVIPDASNVNVKFANSSTILQINNKTSGAKSNITVANWRLVVRAWV